MVCSRNRGGFSYSFSSLVQGPKRVAIDGIVRAVLRARFRSRFFFGGGRVSSFVGEGVAVVVVEVVVVVVVFVDDVVLDLEKMRKHQ